MHVETYLIRTYRTVETHIYVILECDYIGPVGLLKEKPCCCMPSEFLAQIQSSYSSYA